MKDIDNLIKKLNILNNNLESVNNQKQNIVTEINFLEEQIINTKESIDADTFKFVLNNMNKIITKITPKHKIPQYNKIKIKNNITANIPVTNNICSDQNPNNITICPRCTLIHFKSIIEKIIANYLI